MPSNETRCYIDMAKINGNCENVLLRLDELKADENNPIAAVYEKKGGIYEIHSNVCLSDLARELEIPREDIQIY